MFGILIISRVLGIRTEWHMKGNIYIYNFRKDTKVQFGLQKGEKYNLRKAKKSCVVRRIENPDVSATASCAMLIKHCTQHTYDAHRTLKRLKLGKKNLETRFHQLLHHIFLCNFLIMLPCLF